MIPPESCGKYRYAKESMVYANDKEEGRSLHSCPNSRPLCVRNANGLFYICPLPCLALSCLA